MPNNKLEQIKSTYFLFGIVNDKSSMGLRTVRDSFNGQLHHWPIDGYGSYFYTLPFYADKAETDQYMLILLGKFHDAEKIITAEDAIHLGWVSKKEVKIDKFLGDGVIILFDKQEPHCEIYRNLLSASLMYYLRNDEDFIASDNLRLASLFQADRELSEAGLLQHFLSRYTYGRETYFKGVSRLMVGELLTWSRSDLRVNLVRDIKKPFNPENQKAVSKETSSWYFEQLKHTVGIYLNGREKSSAMLLSGGVDSSLVHAAINSYLRNAVQFPSFSYVIDSPGFAYEVEYAKEAARALNSKHTFIELTPELYIQGIIESIEILAEPTDDVRSCFHVLCDHISKHYPEINYLFHGGYADGFNGGLRASRVLQGDKYRSWPIPLLKFIGAALSPISQSKSYGARTAAEVLTSARDPSSKDNYLNSINIYTDWDFVEKCFPPDLIHDELNKKRNIETEYLDSGYLVEKVTTLGTLIPGIRQRAMERSLGYFSKMDFVYPYGDERMIEASGSFTPLERYDWNHRPKPILKLALESQTSNLDLDKPKGWSGYGMTELFNSMKAGELSPYVQEIERPGFVSKSDFNNKINQPDWVTWNLLTFDLLKKHVLDPMQVVSI